MYLCPVKQKHTLIGLFIIAVLLSACNKKQLMPKPNNLIPYDKMVDIMAESYVIESMVYYLSPDSDKVTITRSLYSNLFNEYNITNDQFRTSIKYYLAEKSSADKILQSVSENIAEKRKLYVDDSEEGQDDEFSPK
jgi:hypothetical protein